MAESVNTLPKVSPSVFDLPFMAELQKEDTWRANLECMMPCVVVSTDYSRQDHVVKVLPLVYLHDSTGYQNRSTITCTMWRPFFNNYVIDMPIKKGDTGWVIAADRRTDMVKQNCRPNSSDGYCSPQVSGSDNTHKYRWGLFIPDRWGESKQGTSGDSDYTLAQDDLDNDRFVMQSADSTQRISIGHEDLKAVSVDPSNSANSTTAYVKNGTMTLTVVNGGTTTKLTIAGGAVTMEADTSVTVKTPAVNFMGKSGSTAVDITGTLHVSGTSALDGTVTTKGNLVSPQASFNSHTHKENGVTGTPDSQPPTSGS